jgi:hypothetical protein
MIKNALLLGVGFALGYAKALNDNQEVKDLLNTIRNDQELKDALKDLKDSLKNVREPKDEGPDPIVQPPTPDIP